MHHATFRRLAPRFALRPWIKERGIDTRLRETAGRHGSRITERAQHVATLDTNVVLRWLLDDIAEQTAAADALIASGVECVVPDAVIIETVFVLEKVMRLSRRTIVDSVETIVAVSTVKLDRSLWREALDDYLAHPKLSISDTYLGAHARQSRQLPLYTFDQKLAKQITGAALLG